MCDEILEPKKRGNLRGVRRNALATSPTKAKMGKLVKSIYDRIGLPSYAKDITITVPVDEIDDKLQIEEELDTNNSRPEPLPVSSSGD